MTGVMMRVDKRFKEFVEQVADEQNLSHTEVTRRIHDRMTGAKLFDLGLEEKTRGDSFFGRFV